MLLQVILYALLCVCGGVQAQDKDGPSQPTSTSPPKGQCVGTNELEGLRYHLYSELTESKKEIDSLRNDLQYWQNTTISILKKYLLENQDKGQCSYEKVVEDLYERIGDLQGPYTPYAPNITEETIRQIRELFEEHKRAQIQELREIITEISSGHLPLGTFLNPAPSCRTIPQNSPSGNYWIQNTGTGYASLEYCDMTRTCCNSTGGWMRVAYLDMTDPSHRCPSGFRYIDSPKRTCGRPGSGCYSVTFPLDKISYSRVCGKVIAYQYHSPNAFWAYYNNRALTIDDTYVDGVSLTYGRDPRKHIWTFANALDETRSDSRSCPCIKPGSTFTGVNPPFVGNDYFCDTGSRYTYQNKFYHQDPLWNGERRGDTSTCYEFNNPPWFCKQLPELIADDIELRLCADESNSDEDTRIEVIEIFVQ